MFRLLVTPLLLLPLWGCSSTNIRREWGTNEVTLSRKDWVSLGIRSWPPGLRVLCAPLGAACSLYWQWQLESEAARLMLLLGQGSGP